MRKLPVFAAFSHAVRSTTSNLSFAFHISWPWMAVLLPVVVAANYYIISQTGGDPQKSDATTTLASSLAAVVAMLAFASIAVNWHRYILLDEVPRGAERLRLDAMTWRYFGNFLLILAIMAAIVVVLSVPVILLAIMAGLSGTLDGTGGGIVVAILLVPALVAVATALFYRFGIKLPAIALGRNDFGLRDAWRATGGNTWSIVGLGILYGLLVPLCGLALSVVAGLLGLLGGVFAIAVIVAAQIVANWVLTLLGITLLTSLYGYFVQDRAF